MLKKLFEKSTLSNLAIKGKKIYREKTFPPDLFSPQNSEGTFLKNIERCTTEAKGQDFLEEDDNLTSDLEKSPAVNKYPPNLSLTGRNI